MRPLILSGWEHRPGAPGDRVLYFSVHPRLRQMYRVRVLADTARRLETERAEVAGELAAALQDAATPLTESWGQCQNLIDALQAAPDTSEVRTRLRGAIGRVVAEIWCVFVARGSGAVAVGGSAGVVPGRRSPRLPDLRFAGPVRRQSHP
jgi:hypothetical protein